MRRPISSLFYQGLSIEYQPSTDLICLTDLWQAQCSPARQRPLAWVRLEATQTLLQQLTVRMGTQPRWEERRRHGKTPQRLIIEIPGVLETIETNGELRTYTSVELAVVYAQYLSPECYQWAIANLSESLELVEEWVANQATVESQAQKFTLTRRAVIAAGWAIPVISTLALSPGVLAQISPGIDDGIDSDDDDGIDDDDDDGIDDDDDDDGIDDDDDDDGIDDDDDDDGIDDDDDDDGIDDDDDGIDDDDNGIDDDDDG